MKLLTFSSSSELGKAVSRAADAPKNRLVEGREGKTIGKKIEKCVCECVVFFLFNLENSSPKWTSNHGFVLIL